MIEEDENDQIPLTVAELEEKPEKRTLVSSARISRSEGNLAYSNRTKYLKRGKVHSS